MKRTKGEIIAKVLEICLTAPSKTNVVYGSIVLLSAYYLILFLP
ncbi:MAG: hypothetical protein WB392_15475 [Methanotrichaceae archaeon]